VIWCLEFGILKIMLILLYGKDSYRRQKKLTSIIEEYRKKYSTLSMDYFALENADEFLRFKEFSRQLMIFDNKKMAVLKNASIAEPKELREFLKKYLNDENFTILISEEIIPAELKYLAKKAFLLEKFDPLGGDKWLFFIQKEAKQRNISLTSQAINFLALAFENDGWGLINELNKISLVNSKAPLDINALRKVSYYNYESPDIFDFINSVTRNFSLSQKIIELEKLFIIDEEPVKIFNIMASLKWLSKNLIKKLADYDVMVKSGKIDYEEVLLDLSLSG